MTMRASRLAGAFLLGVLALAGPAAARNLVANGDFDPAQGVSSWTAGSMAFLVWSPVDWLGDPTSGSGRLTNVAHCAGISAIQCVTVPPPLAASYELGAAVFIEPSAGQGSAQITFTARDGTSCSGTTVGSFASPAVTTQGQWISFLDPGLRLPPSTQSVSMQLEVTKLPFLPGCLPLPDITARFDHVRFGPTGTTPVTLESLSIE